MVGGARRPGRRVVRAAARPRAEAPPQHHGQHSASEGPSTSGRSHHHHAPQPPTAYPERRSGALSTLRSPVLRSLALSTVAIPRRQLQERYGENSVAEPEARNQPGSRFSTLPQLLPSTLRLPLRTGTGSAEVSTDSPLAREALTLVLLATAVSFICSIDRAAMSVAILPMGEQFGWDDAVKGSVSSAFFAGESHQCSILVGWMLGGVLGGAAGICMQDAGGRCCRKYCWLPDPTPPTPPYPIHPALHNKQATW